MEQIILKYWNADLSVGLKDWKEVYYYEKDFIRLYTEVYKGNLVYRLPGTSKRFSYRDIKKGLKRKQVIIHIQPLPF